MGHGRCQHCWRSVPGTLLLFMYPLSTITDVLVHMQPKTSMVSAMTYTSQYCHCVCTGHMPTNVIIVSMCTWLLATQYISQV